ncbi:acyl-CoA dehydrogenase family protein [Pseudogemmatithrix spongiicola]|uniref:Acyl-CoA dehydrogenase family protein n=1 Tax=Pseudogemmatithrix spongiicola TaxID=3062599 RepID=A0AA49JWS2_9BACT|nr:acyl-CoA dehydrogenase family protein [Gemmatimonadaceae bacterium 'strain 138']WKW16205.1 acyl-CoA dehydrogenase family protein [Gemmatimonadaceae bacterium 'strain 318']
MSTSKAPHLADPDKNPSFTRGVFQGEILEDLVFPFPEPSAEEKETLAQILDSFRGWAAETVDSAKMDHDGKFTPEVRQGMAELGLMGLNIPEEYGGFGASTMVFSRVFGEIGATDAALAVYFGAHQSIGIKGIILFGTEDQKQRWLPRCASGELIGAFCLTEPGSGSDAQAMLSTAVPSADGKSYTLNGTKIWISNAGYAGVMTVFAKVPVVVDGKEKQRVTAFIVDAKAPGVSLGKIEEKMGIKASDTRTVTFENVTVPAEDRLGDVGSGFKIALEILNSGRLGLAAGSSRGTREMLKMAIEYVKQREQFGRPIGNFEMIQRKVAIAAADCYAADAGWMLCAGMVDRGGVDFSLETAACKVYASELAWRSASDAMQMAGGIGYSKEYRYEQAVRDSRINMIFEGTNEILRALIALMGLQQPGEELKQVGKAFKNPLKNIGAISSYVTGRAKRTITKNKFTKVHEALADEADLVETAIHDLALAVEKALIEHGKDIIERQMLQERMANAAIDIYLGTAVLSRATTAIKKHGEAGAKDDLDAAKIFIAMAMRRARRAIRAIEKNQDDRLRALAKRAYDTGDLTVPTPTDT